MRTLSTLSIAASLLLLISCGGSSSKPVPSEPLAGNWQFNLLQDFPTPPTTLSASGFLSQKTGTLAGSVQGPTITGASGTIKCGGVGPVTGTINGQSVSFTMNPGGTAFNFTGTISSDNKSMSGDYQALGGACYGQPTTGTWNALLVPPVNGSFTGMLSNSTYMQALTGMKPPAPIAISGTINQSDNFGASNATVTGTINAVGYPCFATAAFSGTISGQIVSMQVFGYNGAPIGTNASLPSNPGWSVAPPTGSSGLELTGLLLLGGGSGVTTFGPCPMIGNAGSSQESDNAAVTITLQ